MNQIFQGDHSNAQLALTVKRKRGRPRKDPNLPRVKSVRRPPKDTNQTERAEKNSDADDGMVGKAVTGIVEAVFDAGYLLSVRIGDDNTYLRGIVFKPGHYVPIRPENDIAPNVQMIQRNETFLPFDNKIRKKHKRVKRRNNLDGSQLINSASVAPSVPLLGCRGNVIPVVLQPFNPNPINRLSTDRVASDQENDVEMAEPLSMLPPARSIPMMMNTHVMLPSLTQPSQRIESNNMQSGNYSYNEKSGVVQGEEAKKTESNPPENQHREIGDMNEPPTTAEAVQPNIDDSKSVPKAALMNYGTGRMTELLQALQENQGFSGKFD